jgi:hypothetical protein
VNYKTGAAFRRALEDQLRNRALSTGAPLVRLRKMVAFDRILARLQATYPSAWLLKGGYALQLRFGDRSRTTRDLGGRRFEDFHVDIGTGDPVVEPAEVLETPDLLEFAGIEPVRVRAYPLSQQLAEKLHAYTRPFPRGQQSSRVRDLADILLIASEAKLNGAYLREAIKQTFEARSTHTRPPELPAPPASWSASFRRLNDELDLDWEGLGEATEAARRFLNPILSGAAAERWDPPNWRWE